ncbi:MAG: ATP-binding cassette domain-containing protein [Bacilli bacterium]
MLKVNNIVKYYGTNPALNGLSFEVNDGEIFGLLGENGAGKTTTFRIIMGLLDSTSGDVTLDGKKIDYSVTDKIGFLTEERSLLIKMTVYEQIIYYGMLKSMNKETIEKRLDTLLDRFKITEYKHRKIKELSKGNQQKIQFISAIINEPKLLILDEPFTGLDPINVDLFKNMILELKNKGTIIIFSSHQMEHIEYFCEKLVILVKGKSILEGYLKDIKETYKKKNITIEGDFKVAEIKALKGVIDIIEKGNEVIVKINDKDVVDQVFKTISKYHITKFLVEEASLNEIFIEKVGEAYAK